MAETMKIEYAAFGDLARHAPLTGSDTADGTTVVVFATKDLVFGTLTQEFLGDSGVHLVKKAAAAAKFKGKIGSSIDIITPSGLAADRLIVVGVGGDEETTKGRSSKEAAKPLETTNLGGVVAGKIGRGARATVLFDLPRRVDSEQQALTDFGIGLRLRDYKFDTYKTKKKKDDAEDDGVTHVTIAVADPGKVAESVAERDAVADGVITARSLVNEPANILYPEAFADRIEVLAELGVEVEVLDVEAMRKLSMGAFLGVSQGSARPGRIVIMRWNGTKGDAAQYSDSAELSKPIAVIGKGVTFDTGGISIKSSGGMEDMKGDMAGAACVVGLMRVLASRKAKVDIVGAVGLVENMPGPDAQRPGDIVTSMSGQTIEIINTDAEGRLVLADVCWYVQDKYKPRFMIDLATLTGAIIVALGQEYAGLFSNDDELADRLMAAGKETGEKLWRMPLGPAYDKLIDSRFADVKNSGGRHASSITAAQFIQRFVNDVPWAHLDIAGMGMASPSNDINQSWGSGWGVRLLNRLVSDYYETA